MAQEKIKINDIAIKQPKKDMAYSFETTYTEDTGRIQTGQIHLAPIFTAESFTYEAENISISEMTTILQNIARGNSFKLHYFSPFYGVWRDDYFYVGKGSLSIGTLKEDKEEYESLSFNMIGVNPI